MKKKSILYTSHIASAYYVLKKFQEAIDKSDESLKLYSRNVIAYEIKGRALMKFRRNTEAVESFDKALEIDPNLAYLWMNRGPKAWHAKGLALDKLGEDDAQKYFDKAKELGFEIV